MKREWVLKYIVQNWTHNYELGLVREVLENLSSGIKRCSKRIDAAHEHYYEEFVGVVTDEQCDMVETLLGCAFVVCQTHIGRVTEDVRALHRLANRWHSVDLETTKADDKGSIMAFGLDKRRRSEVSPIAAINTAANYFKHRGEWVGEWSKLPPRQRFTAAGAEALGMSKGCTGNLRIAARAVGIVDFTALDGLTTILEQWHGKVMTAYEKELIAKGLIQRSSG